MIMNQLNVLKLIEKVRRTTPKKISRRCAGRGRLYEFEYGDFHMDMLDGWASWWWPQLQIDLQIHDLTQSKR